MSKISAVIAIPIGCSLLLPGVAQAQFGRGAPEWMTDGGDAQRSAWIRSDPKISAASMSKPGFDLAWKVKLTQEPGSAATLDRYIGYRGFRSFAFMGSASGELTAIDSDLGRVEWTKAIGARRPQITSGNCTGGMTANVTRPTTAAMSAAPAGGRGGAGGGRSQAAKSGVGQPGEGAVTIAEIAARAAADPMAGRAGAGRGAAGAPGRGPAPGGGFGRQVALLDSISADGMLHSMYVSNGEEPAPAVPFVPAGANAHGLIVIDGVAYAATSGSCGGAANGVWGLELASKQVSHWSTSSDLAGSAGFAFGPDATVYAATTSGDLVALEPKTLHVKAAYKGGEQGFLTSPVVFEYKNKTIVAAAAKDGRVHLLDAASLTGSAQSATASGELATWQDSAGARWILAPSKDSITAWRVLGDEDKPSLQSGWTSREMASPLAPVVVNGVVFAVSNGPSAVLYALDGVTGKELWNSGKTIAAPVRYSGLSASGSQIYVGASDRTIYAFGFPIEH